jgi:hypothetical protein
MNYQQLAKLPRPSNRTKLPVRGAKSFRIDTLDDLRAFIKLTEGLKGDTLVHHVHGLTVGDHGAHHSIAKVEVEYMAGY